MNIFTGFFRSKLQNKFSIFFVALVVAPVLILGFAALYLVGSSHQRDISSLELKLIDQKIEEVQKFFADTLGILELRVSFVQKSEIVLSEQQFLLSGILQENTAFQEVSFINLAGMETAKINRSIVAAPLADVSLLPRFQIAVSGKTYIGDVYHTLKGPVVTLAAPVRNRNDEIIQVLSAEVNLSELLRSVESAKLGSSGYLLLLDRNARLIAPQRIGSFTEGVDLSAMTRVHRILGGEELNGLDTEDRYESALTSVSVAGAGKKIAGLGWAILAEWPLGDADAVIQAVRNQVFTVILVSILVVLGLVPFFVQGLLRPIRALEDGAAEIEKGNFQKHVEIQTHDELEDLGEAFNRMAKGLKRLQELRDEFVFIAAHELRSPVTVVRGYVSLLLEGDAGPISDQARDFLTKIDTSQQRLAQLVNDLLDVARSEAGRIAIEVAALDMQEPIRISLEELKPLADKKKIMLSYNPQNAVRVLADSSRVKEIVVNLVGNAIKYSPEGATVAVRHEVRGKEMVTHITDTGYGISKDAQGKMFEKFYRVKTEKTAHIQGTGLGLFIVKQVIEKMNGTIWLESEEGKGTTFSFSLPLA